jgi:ankyrin repeat protein
MSAVAASSSSSPAEAPESLEDQLRDCARFGELEDVEALLAAGARVDDAGPGGSTALHMAAANGHTAVIAALAARGAGAGVRRASTAAAWAPGPAWRGGRRQAAAGRTAARAKRIPGSQRRAC